MPSNKEWRREMKHITIQVNTKSKWAIVYVDGIIKAFKFLNHPKVFRLSYELQELGIVA